MRRLCNDAVREALIVLWEASDRVCGKRLRPLVPILIEAMEQHGHLLVTPEVRLALPAMSAATIDRALHGVREPGGGRKGSVANLGPVAPWRMLVGSWFGGRRVLIEFKGSHFERDVILWGVRWYAAYPISYRQLEEMMQDRGVEVDHSTLNRWVSSMSHCWSRNFVRASVQWVAVGEWTRPISGSKVSGSTCIEPSTRLVPPWTSC